MALMISAPVPSMEALRAMVPLPVAVWEAAEEIADGSDGPGLEKFRLEWLLRAALYVDRRLRDCALDVPCIEERY